MDFKQFRLDLSGQKVLGQNLDSYFSHSLKLPEVLTTVVVDAALTEAAVSAAASTAVAAAAAAAGTATTDGTAAVCNCPHLPIFDHFSDKSDKKQNTTCRMRLYICSKNCL